MGWITPTGHNDPSSTWSSETYAYDDDTGTHAEETISSSGWGNYLELTHAAMNCDKVQVYHSYQASIDIVEIDVYYSSAWHNIYSSSCTTGSFVEYAIGSTQSVTAMRIRYHTTKNNRWVGVNEADFNEAGVSPGWNKLAYTSEPPTPNAWNQLKQTGSSGWVRIDYEGE